MPCAKQIAEFADYMRQEKGLSPHTITYRKATVQDFLTGLERRPHSLRDVSAREIDRWWRAGCAVSESSCLITGRIVCDMLVRLAC